MRKSKISNYTCVANLAKEVADDRNRVIYHNRSEEISEKISTVLKDAMTLIKMKAEEKDLDDMIHSIQKP